MPQKKSLQLAPIADLRSFLSDGELVAFNVGPDFQIYVVVALNELDYRPKASADKPSFPKIKPDDPQTYRVLVLHDGDVTDDVRIADERFNIHDIQPLPNAELLLVCCRSYYAGPNNFHKNGRVYSSSGELSREILLGDGIQNVQTSSTGVIWTSYFDEGIFGNYGWNDPIGSSGLVAWNTHGEKLFEFDPSAGLDSICDCYALNVDFDASAWLYYYTEFPLVHVRRSKIVSHWAMPVAGSDAFAISTGLALFRGGYDERDVYHLFNLGHNGKIDELAHLTLTDEHELPLLADLVVGRSDALYIVRGKQVYRFDIHTAAAAAGCARGSRTL